MSVAGAYILTSKCPPANGVVQAEVLYSLSDGPSRVSVTADMAVLRAEDGTAGPKQSGFSAVGKGF